MDTEDIKSYEEAFISAYGDGGFRLGENKILGSMIINSKGYYPWDITSAKEITIENLKHITEDHKNLEFLMIGMGASIAFLNKDVRAALKALSIAVEVMDTGAAARTYNVLLKEGRKVGFAGIAVD